MQPHKRKRAFSRVVALFSFYSLYFSPLQTLSLLFFLKFYFSSVAIQISHLPGAYLFVWMTNLPFLEKSEFLSCWSKSLQREKVIVHLFAPSWAVLGAAERIHVCGAGCKLGLDQQEQASCLVFPILPRKESSWSNGFFKIFFFHFLWPENFVEKKEIFS